MALSSEQEEKLLRLARSEGWDVLVDRIKLWEEDHTRRLASADFGNLLDVGRLQGQITALRQVVEFVNRRREKAKEA